MDFILRNGYLLCMAAVFKMQGWESRGRLYVVYGTQLVNTTLMHFGRVLYDDEWAVSF